MNYFYAAILSIEASQHWVTLKVNFNNKNKYISVKLYMYIKYK